MRSLTEYKAMLESLKGGTVPAELALEMLAVAEEEIEQALGEYTLTQAMEKSGKSRGYFERRLEKWAAQGLARKPGREWLLKAAVVPSRVVHGGFDPALSDADILAELARMDQVA